MQDRDVSMLARRKAYIGALTLLLGGMLTVLTGFRGIIGPALIGVGLLVLNSMLAQHARVLALLGVGLSFVGLAFLSALTYIPYFYQLRMTDVSSLSPDRAGQLLAGMCLFFSFVATLIVGLILLGVASLRVRAVPRALGVLLILGGLISVSPQLLGSVLGVAGLVWLVWGLRRTTSFIAAEGPGGEVQVDTEQPAA